MKKPLRQLVCEIDKTTEMPKASCVLLRRDDGKILAVSRKDDPEDFGLPGGKQEESESPMQCALRELAEETGYVVEDVKFLFGGVCKGGSDGVDYWTTTYTADYEGAEIEREVGEEETGVVKWVEPEVFLQGAFAEYNQRLFDVLGIEIKEF